MDQLSEDHDSDNGDVPSLSSFTSALITSPAKPSMPAHMTAASPLVEQPDEPNEWRVRAGDVVPSFLYANGPGRIVRYNFNTVYAYERPTLVSRHLVGARKGFSDIFSLTEAGRKAVGTTVGWRHELACTGASLYGKASPNCCRLCCSGFGVCLPDCKGGQRARALQNPSEALALVVGLTA